MLQEEYDAALNNNSDAWVRQQKMAGIRNNIDEVNRSARETDEKNRQYLENFQFFESMEDIEWDFTSTLLARGMDPLAIAVTPVATVVNDPFLRFNVSIHAAGAMENVISMCGYINNEQSYHLTDLKLDMEAGVYNASMSISVIFVREDDENKG